MAGLRVKRLDFRIARHRGLRRAVFLRDDFTCQQCGWRPPVSNTDARVYDGRRTIIVPDKTRVFRCLHLDHIVPLCAGGKLADESNLQTLCDRCNSSKQGTKYV